jgi:hypothetical protein
MNARNYAQPEQAQQPTEIARLFGWVRIDPTRPEQPRMSNLASACHAAAEQIVAGRAELHDFSGMTTANRVKAYAEEVRVRKGRKGLFFYEPDERRLVTRRKVEVKDHMPKELRWERPFKFNEQPQISAL